MEYGRRDTIKKLGYDKEREEEERAKQDTEKVEKVAFRKE